MSCCCGVPEDWNYFKGQMTAAIVKSQNGEIAFDDLFPEVEFYKSVWFRAAFHPQSQEKYVMEKYKNFSLFDFAQLRWNKLKKAGSHIQIYTGGVYRPCRINASGNVVYSLNKQVAAHEKGE